MELFSEIFVDNFAGGGGASTGIKMATGRAVDIAINHDPLAIAVHTVNHPETEHYCESVWTVDPRKAVKGRLVGLAWFSPDCKHHSKARGGKPKDKNIRGLAWVELRWGSTVKPRVMILENVEEFTSWGPLVNGQPDPAKKGATFRAFVNALKRHGYKVQYRELRACDYGAPTTRKRFFMIARCDGRPILWPKPTHGHPDSPAVKRGRLAPWRTAAEIIDWSIPCPSIFDRKKPLADNTMKRIARGLKKYVLENPKPFVLKAEGGVMAPHISRQFGKSVGHNVINPLATVTAGGSGKCVLVSAFLAKHFGGNYSGPGGALTDPLPTVTTIDHNALVTSTLVKLYGTSTGQPVTEPLHTVTAGGNHHAEVRAFLVKYYGTATGQSLDDPLHTVTTKERMGLVTVYGEDYQIVDIGMRMLEPHELYASHGFPPDYIFDRDSEGRPISKKKQVALCGNSVPPVLAESLVRANLPEYCDGVDRVVRAG